MEELSPKATEDLTFGVELVKTVYNIQRRDFYIKNNLPIPSGFRIERLGDDDTPFSVGKTDSYAIVQNGERLGYVGLRVSGRCSCCT